MENKEAIKDKILSDVYYKTFANNQDPILPIYSKPFYRNIIHEAMDLFSASQNKELQKSFENNKEQLMELATHARDLESTIDEKNKEIEILNGLIEDAHNSGWRRGYSLHTEIGESLQQFKSDNNL